MKSKAINRRTPTPAAEETPSNIQFSEQLAMLAYALWEARGCPEGSPDEDWHEATRELVALRTGRVQP